MTHTHTPNKHPESPVWAWARAVHRAFQRLADEPADDLYAWLQALEKLGREAGFLF